MTRLVDRLERQGLLERCQCSDDARGCFAVLTDAGRAMIDRARPTHLDGVRARFLAHLDADDLARLARSGAHAPRRLSRRTSQGAL